MSYELINRITVKKNGVYVSHHSNNDTDSFHSSKNVMLSLAYSAGGQKQLDYAVIRLQYENAKLVGTHPSIVKYLDAIKRSDSLYKEYTAKTNKRYALLTTEDKNSVSKSEKTQALIDYEKYDKELCEALYSGIAALVIHPVSKKPKQA